MAGFSQTVYADDPNVWGNSVTTAIYSGGFTDVDSGALIYLVDMDGWFISSLKILYIWL